MGPDTRTNQPAALLIAEFHIMLKDWRGLQASLEHENWAGSEFIRTLSSLVRYAARNCSIHPKPNGIWPSNPPALRKESHHAPADGCGLGLAERNRRPAVDNYHPISKRKMADQALSQIFFAGGRTRSLLTLFSQEYKARPTDLIIKNNLAMTALLLDEKDLKPYDLARENYETSPTNSSFASTYAFALLLQKKDAQALSVIEQLKPAELEKPSIAGYYGMILQATGNRAKARKYLEISGKSPHLPRKKSFSPPPRPTSEIPKKRGSSPSRQEPASPNWLFRLVRSIITPNVYDSSTGNTNRQTRKCHFQTALGFS
jgi:hypothetical protein